MRTGKKSKGKLQSEAVLIRVQPAEKEAFKECADLAGISLSCWVRERLRTASTRELGSASRRVPFIAEKPLGPPVIDQKVAAVPPEVKPIVKSVMRRQVAPVIPVAAAGAPADPTPVPVVKSTMKRVPVVQAVDPAPVGTPDPVV